MIRQSDYKTRIIANNEFLRISISYIDLIFLIRGTKNSDHVVGTISRYAGQEAKLKRLKKTQESFIIEKMNIKSDKKVDFLFEKLEKTITESLKKDNREKAVEIMKNLSVIFTEHCLDLEVKTGTAQQEMSESLQNKLKKTLEIEMEGLPKNILKKSLSVLN